MRIYMAGSSGSGKSTLAKALAERCGLATVPSASRLALEHSGFATYAALMADRDAYRRFQVVDIVTRQWGLECKAGLRYVSERSIDNAVYASLYGGCGHEVVTGEAFRGYVRRLKGMLEGGDAHLFRVPPTRACFDAALKGGERTEYLIWEDVQRFDGALQMLADCLGLPCRRLEATTVEGRVEEVLTHCGPAR